MKSGAATCRTGREGGQRRLLARCKCSQCDGAALAHSWARKAKPGREASHHEYTHTDAGMRTATHLTSPSNPRAGNAATRRSITGKKINHRRVTHRARRGPTAAAAALFTLLGAIGQKGDKGEEQHKDDKGEGSGRKEGAAATGRQPHHATDADDEEDVDAKGHGDK